ncbi:MAG: hypothetical protein H6828_11475 [Planctomycetes bacterium]|nr:hypothetical protein [Planctomycetota bacterium]
MKLLSLNPCLVVGLVALASGCRSYNDRVALALSTYEAGDFAAAADELTSDDFADQRNGRRDGLLYRLEAAKALQDAGRYAESSAMFDRAVELVEEFDVAADVSISEEVTTLVTDETTRAYRGTGYDRIQLEVYETLNYLARGDLQEALVHTRRAFVRQGEAVARNAEEIAAASERAQAKGVSSEQVFDDPGYVDMRAQLDTLVDPAYAEYVNPAASLLSALLLRESGDDANALVDLRKVLGMVPNNPYLPPLLAEFEAGGAPAAERVYVLLESGMAPRREEFRLTLYTFQQGVSTFAIPRLEPHPNPVRGLRVRANGNALETAHLASLEAMVATDFADRLPGIVLRTVASLIVKEVATHQADQRGGDLGFVLANLWKVATSKADLRTWRTLGGEYELAVLTAPPDGVLELELLDAGGGVHLPTRVELPRARTTILYVRSPSLTALGAHVLSIGPVEPRDPAAAAGPESTSTDDVQETEPDA